MFYEVFIKFRLVLVFEVLGLIVVLLVVFGGFLDMEIVGCFFKEDEF